MTEDIPPDPRENFGETLSMLRRRRRLSMAALAEATGISRQHIWRMEKGIVSSPGKEVLERLAVALAVSVSSLVPAAGGRDRVLNILLQNSSRIGSADFKMLQEIAEELTSDSPTKSPTRSRQSSLRLSQSTPDIQVDSYTHAVSDEIKTIAQFLAEREGQKISWRGYTREAFKLRATLKKRAGTSPIKSSTASNQD